MKPRVDSPIETDAIRPQTLRFVDEGLEADFQSWRLATLQHSFKPVFAIIALVTLNNLYLDDQAIGGSLSSTIYAVRLAILTFTSVGLGLPLRKISNRSMIRVFEVILIMLMIVTLLRSCSEPDYFTVGMIIQFFYILVVYLICPFTWIRQLAYAGLFSLACLVIWEYRIEYTTDFYRLIPSYPCANLLGALLARQRHTQERNLFASERRRGHQLDLVDQLRRQQAEILDLLTHELRQPLASLAAQGELILRLQEPKAIHTIAARIVRISTDAANIIREWIDHDRTALTTVSPSGPKEAVQLLEVIQEVVGHVRREHPELNVAIQVSSVPMIVIDRRVLIIAIHNILINAARYAHSRRGVLIQSRIHSNKVTLRIRDFGPGLTAAEQGDLFLKHVRLNPSRSVGTGVGLYLVRELLNRCGARIRVQSVVGRGTAFIIEISRVV